MMNKTIALKHFIDWYLKSKQNLECLQQKRIEFVNEINDALKEY